MVKRGVAGNVSGTRQGDPRLHRDYVVLDESARPCNWYMEALSQPHVEARPFNASAPIETDKQRYT